MPWLLVAGDNRLQVPPKSGSSVTVSCAPSHAEISEMGRPLRVRVCESPAVGGEWGRAVSNDHFRTPSGPGPAWLDIAGGVRPP